MGSSMKRELSYVNWQVVDKGQRSGVHREKTSRSIGRTCEDRSEVDRRRTIAMNQKKLGEKLIVVEDCVNKVGVDLNTASAPLYRTFRESVRRFLKIL